MPAALLGHALKVHPDASLTGTKHQFKFVARGLSTPTLTQDWFGLWQSPELAPLAALRPRVLLKLQRPYLRYGLDTRQRWDVLQQHYSFARECFSPAALRQIFTPPGIQLARLPEMESGEFSLRLLYDDLFEKEGEVSLMFYDERKQTPLFALSFCVSSWQASRRELFIGGLQGCKQANSREETVAITRGMFGLRPKALLLFGLQQFTAFWNIPSLRAVSNDTRDLRRRKTDGIKADYDEFWLDSSGQLATDGNFTLPATFVPRELADIKPNKRSMYRRRYLLLEDLETQIHHKLDQLSRTPASGSLR